jgi:hypothetical protein
MTDPEPDEALPAISKLFVRALIALGESGETQLHTACTLAASAWSTLRHKNPRDAERFNGVLHRLTRAKHNHT